jgi:hypothetical protein
MSREFQEGIPGPGVILGPEIGLGNAYDVLLEKT